MTPEITQAQREYLPFLLDNARKAGNTPLRLVRADTGQLRLIIDTPKWGERAVAIMSDAAQGKDYSICFIHTHRAAEEAALLESYAV